MLWMTIFFFYALDENHTWELVDLPKGKGVFAIKVNPDGSVASPRARLVAKGYA